VNSVSRMCLKLIECFRRAVSCDCRNVISLLCYCQAADAVETDDDDDDDDW